MEEDQHRNSENMEEMRNQLIQLSSVSMYNNRKFEDMVESMEFMKRIFKGKFSEGGDVGSSTHMEKGTTAKNTGYPPGFTPVTPTNMGINLEQQAWDDSG